MSGAEPGKTGEKDVSWRGSSRFKGPEASC